jgi:hypothetical protein
MIKEMFRELVRSKVAPAGKEERVVKLSKQQGNTMALWKSDQLIVV